jgi:hypothetical protein
MGKCFMQKIMVFCQKLLMQRGCEAEKEKALLARAKDSCIALKSHDDEIRATFHPRYLSLGSAKNVISLWSRQAKLEPKDGPEEWDKSI